MSLNIYLLVQIDLPQISIFDYKPSVVNCKFCVKRGKFLEIGGEGGWAGQILKFENQNSIVELKNLEKYFKTTLRGEVNFLDWGGKKDKKIGLFGLLRVLGFFSIFWVF